MPALIDNQPKPAPRALLIAVRGPDEPEDTLRRRSAEMERLAHTLGIQVVERSIQRRAPTPGRTFLGSGRLEELAGWLAPPDEPPRADLVLVDASLTPGQQRALELALHTEVLDRTAVILEIFEQRASSRQAPLELELARLRYQLPRVRDTGVKNDRRGGGGRGERGHTNTTLEKQRIRDRIAQLTAALDQQQAASQARRQRRSELFQVALVGYTNAGKSTLMRGLTGSDALADDLLFATVGTMVRQLQPQATPPVLVSDTVGFIRDLPHELVASFHSTLDEARDADLLLLVLDASDEEWREQLQVTRDTLETVGAGDRPQQVVLNKVDRLHPEALAAIRSELPDALAVSALDSSSVAALHASILTLRDRSLHEELVFVPLREGRWIGEIFARAHVLEQEAGAEGTLLRVRASEGDLGRWQQALGGPLDLADADAFLVAADRYGLTVEILGAPEEAGPDFRRVKGRDEAGRPWLLWCARGPTGVARLRAEERALRRLAEEDGLDLRDRRLQAGGLLAICLDAALEGLLRRLAEEGFKPLPGLPLAELTG